MEAACRGLAVAAVVAAKEGACRQLAVAASPCANHKVKRIWAVVASKEGACRDHDIVLCKHDLLRSVWGRCLHTAVAYWRKTKVVSREEDEPRLLLTGMLRAKNEPRLREEEHARQELSHAEIGSYCEES